MDSVDNKFLKIFSEICEEYDDLVQLTNSIEIMSDNRLYAFYIKKMKKIELIATLYKEYLAVNDEIDLLIQQKAIQNDADNFNLNKDIENLNLQKNEIFNNLKTKYNDYGKFGRQKIKVEISSQEGGDFINIVGDVFVKSFNKNDFKINIIKSGCNEIFYEVYGDGAYEYYKNFIGKYKNIKNGREEVAVVVILKVNEEVFIDESDIEIQTLKSGGAGGQHINKTESAVRVKHIPTGIVAECQDDRSQFKNKERALEILKEKIFNNYAKNAEKNEKIQRKSMKNAIFSDTPLFVFNQDKNVFICTKTKKEYKLNDIFNGDLELISSDLRV